jgi:L-asparaginase / beta-aspartyl-peptidase
MPAIIVHGGAGDIPTGLVPKHIEGCRRAARAGHTILAAGGSALDAVEAAVRALEDDPTFNAGTGACLNEDGAIELDACIMEGTTLRAGAVAALPPFRAPIAIARRVLEHGEHVLYAGAGAARFATIHGFAPVTSADLTTSAARARWETVKSGADDPNWAGGTVGAVALDGARRLAAATSTGGITNKRVGRVGDSAIVGAGNVADDEAGAASATGNGEPIMRIGLGHFVLGRLRDGASAAEAAEQGLAELARRTRGTAGIIVVDREGRVGRARTTRSMSWASVSDRGDDAGT